MPNCFARNATPSGSARARSASRCSAVLRRRVAFPGCDAAPEVGYTRLPALLIRKSETSDLRSEAERCAADPGSILPTKRSGPRVCTASLRCATCCGAPGERAGNYVLDVLCGAV